MRTMHLGKVIRIVRVIREMTQKELAEALGCDHSYISLIESGHRIPSWGLMCEIAKAFRIPTSRLVSLAETTENEFLQVEDQP